MAIRYKIDILAELKKIGYSSTRIREEKLIGQSYLQQLRHGELVSWKTLDTICSLLECQPADLIEYVKDEEQGVQLNTTFPERFFWLTKCQKSTEKWAVFVQVIPHTLSRTQGGVFRAENFFNGVCRFGVALSILEWDFYFESRFLHSCAEFMCF